MAKKSVFHSIVKVQIL